MAICPFRGVAVIALVLAAWLSFPAQAKAVPVFAHRFGFYCQQCHTTIPALNAYGRAFLDNGYELPELKARGVVPVAVKINLAYSSSADDSGLPKALVDELEVISGGHVAKRLSYFIESYVVDGGRPGRTRDVWLQYADAARGVRLIGGQFGLRLPVEPETFRDTSSHYAIFDQRVGASPFNLFDPRIGATLEFGDERRGFAGALSALAGHDPGSGLPSRGTDVFGTARIGGDRLQGVIYNYRGVRPLGPAPDAIRRWGYGVNAFAGRLEMNALLQTGSDSSADGMGDAQRSSGGYVQAIYRHDPAMLWVVRYDAIGGDTMFSRALVIAGARRVARNARFTVEDSISAQRRARHALTAALLFAY